MDNPSSLSRREFLKLGALGLGALALRPWRRALPAQDFPQSERLGRVVGKADLNARPGDAKWIFRWTQPVVPYDPGDVTVSMPGGTLIEVVERQR